MVAIERLQMALSFSVSQTKIGSRNDKLNVGAALKIFPELNELRATVKKALQELKFLLLKFNGAAVTSISLNLDPDNYIIKTLLNMDEHRDRAENFCSEKKVDDKRSKRQTENPSCKVSNRSLTFYQMATKYFLTNWSVSFKFRTRWRK